GGRLTEEVSQLKQGSGSEILIFGSPRATHALMAENLVDEYWLFLNPILLGKGVPLFRNIQQKTALTLYASKVFECGVVCLCYERKKA
ncbi:MAG: dihydrofolate reductase family protein, partial [Spirochaetia bacterium]|nr:dihydrofolate reductase family protein [Spirochaetia bacterium]